MFKCLHVQVPEQFEMQGLEKLDMQASCKWRGFLITGLTCCLPPFPSFKNAVKWDFFFFPVGFHCRLQNILYYSWQHLPWTGVCISLKRSQFSYRRGGPISCILGTRCCPTQYLNNEYGWKVMKNDCFMSINFFGHPACCFLGTPPSLTCTEPLLLPSNNSGAREVDTPFMAWIQPSTESGVYAFDTAVMRNSLCPQCEIPAPRTTSKIEMNWT